MSFNVEEFINRYKERAEAVKNRSIPPVGGDDRMAFIKQAETDFQDYMIIADSEFTVCLLYTSPSPRDKRQSRMPSSA